MKSEIYAYAGKILRVDLTTETISTEPTIKYAREWLGGRGIGQWLLYNELQPWVTPYEPANRIVVSAGSLVGTLAPAATRLSIASKNVFSHGVGTGNSCGLFAPELKFAGYDTIVFQGRARKPVYLWIDDDHVELKDAKGIWGKTTWETDDLIKAEIGDEDIQIISIGPAGENLVKAACIMANRNRAAARCGLGGIMGSKNLKAVAVRGTGSIEVAYPDRFMEAVDSAWQSIRKSGRTELLGKCGTWGLFPKSNIGMTIQYKNFQDAYVPEEAMKKLDPEVFLTRYKKRDIGYMACPIACGTFCQIDHGPYAGFAGEGLELTTLKDFGGKLAIDDAAANIRANALSNQLGLDISNAVGAIAWAFECYQRGIITEKDTDGLKLEWGDYGVVFELMRKMAHREGFGNMLAEGCKRASEMLGRDSGYYAISLKGMDLYETVRIPIGWSLGACTATRGGGHTTGSPVLEPALKFDTELARVAERVYGVKTFEPREYEEKAKLVTYIERVMELVNSLGVCMFVSANMDPGNPGSKELAELYSAATGWETTEKEFIRIADRILNVEKAFNGLHTNLGRKDDYPPERCLTEPIKSGPYKGFALSKEKWDKMLDEYYELHGWDAATGLQTRRCLEDLGLKHVADDLEKAGRLAT